MHMLEQFWLEANGVARAQLVVAQSFLFVSTVVMDAAEQPAAAKPVPKTQKAGEWPACRNACGAHIMVFLTGVYCQPFVSLNAVQYFSLA